MLQGVTAGVAVWLLLCYAPMLWMPDSTHFPHSMCHVVQQDDDDEPINWPMSQLHTAVFQLFMK